MKFEELDFDTQAKKDRAIAVLNNLKTDEGWIIVMKALQANIQVLNDQILDGYEGESVDELNRKRDKRTAYKEAMEMPDFIINKLQPATTEVEDSDPYDTVESLAKKRAR